MQKFQIATASGRSYDISVEEVDRVDEHLVQTLVEIDLQTFTESTFSRYTAAAFFLSGRVFLLKADDIVIGTCACMRTWDRPNEVHLLSMGIRPGWRGKGLGHRFLHGVLERLAARGIRAVTLMVSADNRRAHKLYSEVGFETMAELPERPAKGGVGRERFVAMTMRLREAPIAALPGQELASDRPPVEPAS
ncbi:MAG: GNAT family N-acetyltransferase [Deltaproteobacteria bacterium]|nr:MAG: GNAT family N-acetyltransferase [Deltaproteobacteria bacterium]